ncbi:hypothetical protein RCL1_000368 [Eukaryota sp. TZLM3-RCL]
MDLESETTWITWYCSLKGSEFFCEVDQSFLVDDFNMMGLSAIVPNYKSALDIILDRLDVYNLPEENQYQLAESARLLYGLAHARYILTNPGINRMAAKYEHGDFGTCTRVLCDGNGLLPVGLYDSVGKESVLLYCHKCNRLYRNASGRHRHCDGAFWGTTFAHLFFLMKPNLKPSRCDDKYVPKLFGFRIREPQRTVKTIVEGPSVAVSDADS